MMRVLYRLVILLHPPGFRREYGDEMLWLFDRTVKEKGAGNLFLDATASVLRQWFLRSRLWLVPVALLGALFTVLAGNALLHFVFRRVVESRADTPQELFLFAAALAVITVSFILIAATASLKRQTDARRTRATRVARRA
jgi:hypothetical protein